ncbi:hypothetical protein [Massilia sp. YMA4]|uniref:hypothetical protein n=1 Tax=Massilia sp. YMA4 TaxID=1593482 RepID=UPI0015824F04|nr:hypothetical protein [Massilia sp. YMA4]
MRKKLAVQCLIGTLTLNHHTIVKAEPSMHDQENSRPASTATSYWLSAQQKATLSENAKRGDKHAAFRLAQYYSFVEFDRDKEQYWLECSAKAGLAVAQYNLSFLLLNKEEPELGPALYWAEMAKQNGESKAQSLIDEIHAAGK